jgi:hypothetical protein
MLTTLSQINKKDLSTKLILELLSMYNVKHLRSLKKNPQLKEKLKENRQLKSKRNTAYALLKPTGDY